MTTRTWRSLGLVASGAACVLWLAPLGFALSAAENAGVISGTVTSTSGPEAGVWVIAETDDLETVFRKIVVTNDDGKFCCPSCRT